MALDKESIVTRSTHVAVAELSSIQVCKNQSEEMMSVWGSSDAGDL